MPLKTTGSGAAPPFPRYAMYNRSESPYNGILRELADAKSPVIGFSYYYIRAESDWRCLCRLTPTQGPAVFHEIIDPEEPGISDAELQSAIRQGTRVFTLPGFYGISPEIGEKLRARYGK